jgi:hypothetical protein
MAILLRTNTDANNFLDAAGIARTEANGSIVIGICQLTTDLKNYGLWDKMKAIYPMVGGTSGSHKFNLKDPRDADSAFRLVFSGSWAHSSTGATPNGAVGTYADTYLNLSTQLTNRNVHISNYARAGSTGNEVSLLGMPGGQTAPGGIEYNVYNSTKMYSTLGGSRIDITIGSPLVFHTLTSLDGSTNGMRAYTNGILRGTATNNSPGLINANLLLANGYLPSPFECSLASIGDGLTDTEATNFYTAVQRFQTTLGRQV